MLLGVERPRDKERAIQTTYKCQESPRAHIQAAGLKACEAWGPQACIRTHRGTDRRAELGGSRRTPSQSLQGADAGFYVENAHR